MKVAVGGFALLLPLISTATTTQTATCLTTVGRCVFTYDTGCVRVSSENVSNCSGAFRQATSSFVPVAGSVAARSLGPNKLNHIFGKAEHGLEGLLRQSGSQEAAYQAIQRVAEGAVKAQKLAGVIETTVDSNGSVVLTPVTKGGDPVPTGLTLNELSDLYPR
jgi:hypothetical protein